MAGKVTPRHCIVGNTDGRDFWRNWVRKKEKRTHWNCLDLYPFSSFVICLLPLRSNHCSKSLAHLQPCYFPEILSLGMLVTQFLPENESSRARITNLLYSFAVPFHSQLSFPEQIWICNSVNDLTIDMLHKLHPMRAVFIILYVYIKDIVEIMTWS